MSSCLVQFFTSTYFDFLKICLVLNKELVLRVLPAVILVGGLTLVEHNATKEKLGNERTQLFMANWISK